MFSVESLYLLIEILRPTCPRFAESLKGIENPMSFKEIFNIFGLKNFPEIIFSYEEKNLSINPIHNKNNSYGLFVGNERWMTFTSKNSEELFEFYSHYNLAKGHCICTGLGFGLREEWLLSKKEVSKITVIEKNIEVINYHKKINPNLLDRIEVINCDASEYVGQCDTLLLDHYESLPFLDIVGYLENVKRCSNNISHNTLWFWPLEQIISKNYDTMFMEYTLLKKRFTSLPNINEEQLRSYSDMFYFGNKYGYQP